MNHLAIFTGHVLREIRTEKGKNLRDIEGIAIGYLSNVERGTKNISPDMLQHVCKQLDTPLSVFLYRVSIHLKEVEKNAA